MAGQIDEPAPSTTSASIDLTTQFGVANILLKANQVSTVTLRGPVDLDFAGFALRVTAKPLQRDMALPEWGTAVTTGKVNYYFLPSKTQIDSVEVRGTPTVTIKAQNGGTAIDLGTYPPGSHPLSFVTDTVSVDPGGASTAIRLLSSSLPSQAGYAINDGTKFVTFSGLLTPDAPRQSAELAPVMNDLWDSYRAWPKPPAEVTLPLYLTAASDGLINLDLLGSWSRTKTVLPQPVTLDGAHSLHVLPVQLPWGDLLGGSLAVGLSAQVAGPGRLGLIKAQVTDRTHDVPLSETVQVAQILELSQGLESPAACTITAVWLCLPERYATPQPLQLSLMPVADQVPSGTPFATQQVLLPGDRSAYIPFRDETGAVAEAPDDPPGYWYRAVLTKPVQLTDEQAQKPLAVVAGGFGPDGEVQLVHVQRTDPVPALTRDLAVSTKWRPQASAQWLVDLECSPVASPPQPSQMTRQSDGSLLVAGLAGQSNPVKFSGLDLSASTTSLLLRFAPRLRGGALVTFTYSHVYKP